MARVRLSEPCVLEDVRYEPGDVVEVSDQTAELNSGWMAPTSDALTPAKATATKEAKKSEDK